MILNLNKPEDVKEMASTIAALPFTSISKVNQAYTEILQSAQTDLAVSEDDGITHYIGALLSLDDEEFALISPLVLDEINSSYKDTNNMALLTNSFIASGYKLEELRAVYEKLVGQLDELVGSLSQIKIDFFKEWLWSGYNALAGAEGIARQIVYIPLEFCNQDAKMPTYAHINDAGVDLYATEDITIAPGETKLIKTGIKVAIPDGYELQVRPKSGISLKTKLRVANAPGTIDSGYRDEIGVIIDNTDQYIRHIETEPIWENGQVTGHKILNIEYGQSYTIGKGQKFAQMVLNEIAHAAFGSVDTVKNIGEDRGGGYGSTGLN